MPNKDRTFRSRGDRHLEVVEPMPEKVTTYSYEFIVNRIQELQTELMELRELKKEADKLNLKR